MMRALKKLFGAHRPIAAADSDNGPDDDAQGAVGTARELSYPPRDPGMAVRPLDEVLATHDELIQRIKLCYGADRDTFDADLLSLIRRYAHYVYLLPATPDNYFSLPGGLLRMGLEVAFYALQATDGQIFSGRSTITHRRQLEPRWRRATFIAGLCSELHRAVHPVIVTDPQGNPWPAYLSPLYDWLQAQRASRFFLHWIPQAGEIRSLNLFALTQIVDPATLHDLAQGNSVVVAHLMASISGSAVDRPHNILDHLVRRATALVIDRDLQASALRHGKPPLGSHLERFVVEALRRLVASNPRWIPNAEKSRLWFGEDGLYMVWPNAVHDIGRQLEADQLAGIPKDAEPLLRILIDAGTLTPSTDTSPTWAIVPPHSDKPIDAVRFAAPSVLLAALDHPPAPLPYELAKSAPGSRAAHSTTAAPAVAPEPQRAPAPAAPIASGTPAPPVSSVASIAQPRTGSPSGEPLEAPVAGSPSDPLHTPARSHRPRLAIRAPLRLDAAVRAALGDIVERARNDDSSTPCRPIPAGLFVPLDAFVARAIEPAHAIRALADASMLTPSSSSGTPSVTLASGGKAQVGVIIDRGFIEGLAPADCAPTPTAGTLDAASSL